jgi:low affinity Fe/Cu permease
MNENKANEKVKELSTYIGQNIANRRRFALQPKIREIIDKATKGNHGLEGVKEIISKKQRAR